MSFQTRLKERRVSLNLSQADLAKLLGITPGAISNYENGVSSPKADILYKVFDVLKCDANFLFQDEMKELETENFSTPEIKMIKKYRALDEHGKRIVDFVLDEESERMNAEDSEYMYAAARDGGLVKIPKPDEEAELPEKDSFIDGL